MMTYPICLFETLFRVGFKIPPPSPLFARRDYKPIDKVWAMVMLGTAPKATLLTMKEMAGRGEETEMSSLYIATQIS